MKLKFSKRWGSFLLAMVLIFSLIGCAGDSNQSSSTSSTGGSAASSAGDSSASTGESSAEVSGTGTSDTFIADRTITIQAYVDDIGYTLPDSLADTAVMKELTARTGISLNIQYTPGDSDETVMATQLAAGTIPEVIISYLDNSTRPEFSLLYKAAKEGMFADLSEYMKNSTVYSKYYEEDYLPNDTYNNIVFREDFSGAAYLLHLNIDEVDRSTEWIAEDESLGGMYIQSSIAEDLGIDVTAVNTQEDFYDLLVAIKEGGYTDDNGNAVYPLGPKYWGGSEDALQYIVPGYNWGIQIGDEYNVDETGTILHEIETDYVYDKINYVRKLLDEGLMNPEFFTMDSTRAEEVSKTKNSAIIADVHNYEEIIYGSDDWIPLGRLNDITGDNSIVVSGKSGRGVWAISADAENPEEIFKFFDYLSTDEGQLLVQYGVEGENYEIGDDGNPKLMGETAEKLDEGDTDWLIQNVGAGFGGTGNYFFEFVLTNKNNLDNFGESRPGASVSSTYERSVEIAETYEREKKLIPGLRATAYLSADELADVKSQMDLLDYNEMLVQAFFASSDSEVTSIVESFKAQLEAAGLQQFKDYIQKVYDEDNEAISFLGTES